VNPLQPTYGGGDCDALIAKVSADGAALVYSTYLGGSDWDQGDSIAVDSSGSAYVTGFTFSANFPTVNPLQASLRGQNDAFISKVGADGTSLVYSTYLGGSGHNYGRGIAVDSEGSAYVTGSTFSANFPTVDPLQATSGGYNDAFISKVSADGASLVFSTYLGGSGNDGGYGIAVDSSGNVYVIGFTGSANFPTTEGAFARTCGTDGLCNPFFVCDFYNEFGYCVYGHNEPVYDVFVTKIAEPTP
jgi:hypothetical protein